MDGFQRPLPATRTALAIKRNQVATKKLIVSLPASSFLSEVILLSLNLHYNT